MNPIMIGYCNIDPDEMDKLLSAIKNMRNLTWKCLGNITPIINRGK